MQVPNLYRVISCTAYLVNDEIRRQIMVFLGGANHLPVVKLNTEYAVLMSHKGVQTFSCSQIPLIIQVRISDLAWEHLKKTLTCLVVES